MRVLMTTDTIGGVWTFTRELASGLVAGGHTVALVSLGRELDRDQQAWVERAIAGSWGRFTHYATASPLEWMQQNEHAFRHSAAMLERLAETFQADVIHSSQFCFGALATRVPVLITAHSDVLSWAAASRPDALAESPWLTRYKSLVQHGLYAAAGVAAPTRWMLEALEANFELPFRRFVASNGRTLDEPGWPIARAVRDEWEIEYPDPTWPERKLQAVTAGRLWDEAKNLALLTRLATPMPLIIAGEAPPEDAPAGIRFTGPLAEQALLNLFRESAIYVCPSKYEPFGLAPLEAALCGCAVLANDIASLRQVWGEAALYFRDAPTLERLLAELSANPAQLAEAQQRSFTRAQSFSRGRMTAHYLRCYRQVLQAHEEPAHAA